VRRDRADLNIRARKAVVIGTGGSTGNVNFRRMFDPRLTEEYCGLAGMPWSDQDASGELAAMADSDVSVRFALHELEELDRGDDRDLVRVLDRRVEVLEEPDVFVGDEHVHETA